MRAKLEQSYSFINLKLFVLNVYCLSNKIVMFLEAAIQTCSVKKVFLEISQNSWENTCARDSLLIKLQVLGLRSATLFKKSLWHRCFPMNFAKHLRGKLITSMKVKKLRYLLYGMDFNAFNHHIFKIIKTNNLKISFKSIMLIFENSCSLKAVSLEYFFPGNL